MNRRTFIRTLSAGLAGAFISSDAHAAIKMFKQDKPVSDIDKHIKDYLNKIEHFDEAHPNDLYLDQKRIPLLKSTLEKLTRVQSTVGHGFFCLISIDKAIKIAGTYPSIGAFAREELDFLEMLFYKDGAMYGFLGEKPLYNFTDTIPVKEAMKIPGTGNYLFRGRSVELYKTIRDTIGPDVILTSGIRSVTKQFMLFLNKAMICNGNLSMASRSLAPPGYSYHAVGDFDVGQVGFGKKNFTSRFTETPVFKQLVESGYATLRYTRTNSFGVRFEPWHIKVT
jgi:hypothetical protein